MNLLKQAHLTWKEHLESLDTERPLIIDATCGNGHDSLFLSSFEEAELHCVDIQEQAIKATSARLPERSSIHFHHQSHEDVSFTGRPIDLIVYNLGYLPGSDKSIITTPNSTLTSLESASKHLSPSGMISLMIYKGHEGGMTEYKYIINYIEKNYSTLVANKVINHLKPTCPEFITLTRQKTLISV